MRDHVWYIKYASAITILCAMVLHVFGITPWNSFVQMIGAVGWIYVGYKWNERGIDVELLAPVLHYHPWADLHVFFKIKNVMKRLLLLLLMVPVMAWPCLGTHTSCHCGDRQFTWCW
jgi:hypothetical protein